MYRMGVGFVLFLLVAHADAFAMQDRVTIPGYDKPVVTYYARTGNPGLVVALHGTGGSGPQFAGAVGAERISSAGYIVASPTSLAGAWGSIATGGNKDIREKESKFVRAIIDYFVKNNAVHPDKIHVIGYSAGSAFLGGLLRSARHLDGIRIRSFCGHSGGFASRGGNAPASRKDETSVWILNGTRDRAHADPSTFMYLSFKEAGYDAKYTEVPGAGHGFPITPMSEVLAWWKQLDAKAPDIGKVESSIKAANKHIEKGKWGHAYRSFKEAEKAARGASRFRSKIEPGLQKVEAEGRRQIEEARGLKDSDLSRAKKLLKKIQKDFKGGPVADEAKALYKELK